MSTASAPQRTFRACPLCVGAAAETLFVKDGFTLRRCSACQAVFVGEDPAAIDFQALYGEAYYRGGHEAVFADYTGQESARRAHARRKLLWLRTIAPRIARGGRLLDVGCAAGFFLAEARRWYEVQGVELSSWSSDYARERFQLPVHTGTLIDAALPTDHFDVVTLWDVIEHVPDPVPLLTEAARVMKPGARLVLTTGDWGSRYAQRHGADWHLMTPPWHLTMFTRDSLQRAASAAGLRVVAWRSEGVAGDGRFWRSKPMLALSRALGWGDIVRLTLTK